MSCAITEQKKKVRKHYLAIRNNISGADNEQWSTKVCERLSSIEEIHDAQWIGAYISDGSEVDLSSFIELSLREGKRVIVPRYNGSPISGGYEMVSITDPSTQLQLGHYNIPEPRPELPAVNLKELNNIVWLVPGVVFDKQCHRLGRGKGIYDQLLKNHGGTSIGVFFDCQECDAVPMETHDYPLDMIVTQSTIYRAFQA